MLGQDGSEWLREQAGLLPPTPPEAAAALTRAYRGSATVLVPAFVSCALRAPFQHSGRNVWDANGTLVAVKVTHKWDVAVRLQRPEGQQDFSEWFRRAIPNNIGAERAAAILNRAWADQATTKESA